MGSARSPRAIESIAEVTGRSFRLLRLRDNPFTEFLSRVRLDQARQRILAGDESVSTIAFAVGFNHLSHFNRAYRKNFRRTPTNDRMTGKLSNGR